MGHEFEKKINDLKIKSDGIVSFMGKYDESNVITLMSMVDVVVIPSRWWENSPVIIDEARAAGVPMLVSNHGGLKEKVVDAGYGWPFLPGSSASLANEMLKLIENPDKLLSAKSKIRPPTSINVITNRLLDLYGK
jgi:glycosyltransferase involved in cell wall biosynthesis